MKNTLLISAFGLLIALSTPVCSAMGAGKSFNYTSGYPHTILAKDTVPPAEVMDIVTTVVYSLNTFNIEKVADLYTPNAVVADDEPPYSWNGPTAGIQWVNAVEKVCKENRLTKLKGTMEAINVFQQTSDNVYIVVPVNYTGDLPHKQEFRAEGAFTFVLRLINGKWMIKSQVWMPRRGM